MPLHRRDLLRLGGFAVALPAMAGRGWAQAYPTRPVHLIVGFAASGGNDIVARIIGQWLSERLGQPFVVENRPGAGSNIATQAVIAAPPDGHTLLLASASNAINATLYEKLSFEFVRDITAVGGIMRVPSVIVLNASSPLTSFSDFVAYARQNPGKLAYTSGGIGTPTHMAGELLKMAAGIDMLHVPYRGTGPATTDLLGGQVQLMFSSATVSMGHIKSGALRAIAVTSSARLELLPDVPTVAEFVPGYEGSQWYGIAAPKATPRAIVERLNAEINAALVDPTIKARFADLGGTVLPGGSAAFATFIADDTEKWSKVVKFSNARVN
jgi:tripartite-type tricarboxylate transporter receptor subunit TctC